MHIDVINNQKSLSINASHVKRIVKTVIAFENKKFDEAAIYFVDKDKISEMHAQFFNDPSPTDCLSFPIDNDENEGYLVLGDSFICPQTAIEYAAAHNADPYEEVTLYIVHCLLHLMGYDDISLKDQKKMRAAESRHMEHLQELNLYLKGK